jgi:hypothetical protein
MVNGTAAVQRLVVDWTFVGGHGEKECEQDRVEFTGPERRRRSSVDA